MLGFLINIEKQERRVSSDIYFGGFPSSMYQMAGAAVPGRERFRPAMIGAGVDQIQWPLGHKSLKTTERYLGVEQNLTDAPGDRLGLSLEG